MDKEYNNLFFINKKMNFNLKSHNLNNLSSNTQKNNSITPYFIGNKIKIITEENKNERFHFTLNNNLLKESPLVKENQELNKQLNDVCEVNEILEEEIKNLKIKLNEIVKIITEKEKQAKKWEKDYQILEKKLSNNIDELKLENINLDKQLKDNQNLRRKIIKKIAIKLSS